MVISATLAQAQALRTILGANAICLYVRDVNDTNTGTAQLVSIAAILDAKMGSVIIRWATDADKPTVAQIQAAFTNRVEVASLDT